MTTKEIQSFDKPCGFNSHRVNETTEGFLEYISRINNKKFWLCHRLDKDTSGVILFAGTKEASQIVYDLFFNNNVEKKYLFFTDRKIIKKSFSIKSRIEKHGKEYISLKTSPNAETGFKFLKEMHGFYLFEATPVTGKTHQIRIHAKDANIPILGDKLYGGTDFFRLMLHCSEMKLKFKSDTLTFSSKKPVFFENLNILSDTSLSKLIHSIDTRLRLFANDNSFSSLPNSIRLIHTEHPYLRCDKLGDVLWFSSFHLEKTIADILPLIKKLQNIFGFTHYFLRLMPNRGEDPNKILTSASDNLPLEWIAKEERIKFQVKTTSGTSSGIFLDQRRNRGLIYNISNKKKVLNLYSYTGVFSVCAALGKAHEVVSVDTSKRSLEWAKENFKLNKLEPLNYEFWSFDSEKFLDKCIRNKRYFDIIICDPPSFARSKKGVFKLEKSFETLIKLCHKCLFANGTLLFSSNFEKWIEKDFKKRISEKLFKTLKMPFYDYDFELPGEKRILKTFRLEKK